MKGKRVLGWVLIWVCLLGSTILADRRSSATPQEHERELELAVAASTGGWIRQCVGCRAQLDGETSHGLQVDQAGHLHLIYGSGYLYHAWHNGSRWQTEIIDRTNSSHHDLSSALDENGRLHISYILDNQDTVKYAFQGSDGWHIRTVDVEPYYTQYMRYTSLALDGQGMPHIAYWNGRENELMYAYRDATGWHRQVAARPGDTCRGVSLDVDGSRKPHIGYVLGAWGDELRYVRLGAGGWQAETISSAGSLWVGADWLALDGSDQPHVGYYDGNLEALRYAHRDISGWHTETVDSGDMAGQGAALLLDGSGRAHLSYWEHNNGLKYAYQDGTGWQVGLVEGVDPLGFTALVLDASSVPHVSYLTEVRYPDNLKQLRHATLDGANWQSQVVVTAGGADHASLALDTNDVPHVTYCTTPESLAYAYWEAGAWHSEIVDRAEPFRYLCDHALALDGDGAPHIAYKDSGRLKYATLDAGGWHTQTVESRDSGHAVAIALDGDGYPHLSYMANYPTFDLLYAYLDASGWHLETIASGLDEPNSATSLVLDASGYPHLTFSSYGSATGMRYVYKDAGGWHIQSLNGEEGRHAALVLDRAGRPHISYRGYVASEDSQRIRYAFKDAGGWDIQSVDEPVSYDGGYTSLALDASEVPHISYYDDVNTRLRYAFWDADSWRLQTVDDVGYVGQYPSLALDSSGHPHVAYNDLWANDVKYAYWVDVLPYAVSISAPDTALAGYAGATVTYTLQITNDGSQSDTFDADVWGHAWTTLLPDGVGPLGTKASATLLVTVRIPTDATLGASDVVYLTVTSMSDRDCWAEVTLTTYLKAHELYMPVLLRK